MNEISTAPAVTAPAAVSKTAEGPDYRRMILLGLAGALMASVGEKLLRRASVGGLGVVLAIGVALVFVIRARHRRTGDTSETVLQVAAVTMITSVAVVWVRRLSLAAAGGVALAILIGAAAIVAWYHRRGRRV